MFGLTIPFAIEATRRNPVRTAVRNLAMSQGDDLQLAITVYGRDGATIDITEGVLTAFVQREAWGCPNGSSYDYGLGWLTTSGGSVWSGMGVVTAGQSGTAVVSIPRAVTTSWWGRFRLFIAIDDTTGGCITAEGILDVRPCPQRPVLVAPPVVVPPITYGVDFDGNDFLPTDFLTSSINSGAVVVHLIDDFGRRISDDFGRSLSL